MFLAEVNYLFILGGLFAIIIVMILVIYLFETASYLKLYRALPSNLGKAIYGYLDKNGDLVCDEMKQENYIIMQFVC